MSPVKAPTMAPQQIPCSKVRAGGTLAGNGQNLITSKLKPTTNALITPRKMAARKAVDNLFLED